MNKLRIRLNDRKRFVFSAALGAVLVLLAGGANALAITTNTVWCVPNTSISPTCTPGAGKAHIQDAIYAPAMPGDVILVGPGYYHESVDVNVANLSIFGAQAGKDARVDRNEPWKESIVDASTGATGGGGGAAFYVDGEYVVIDGFTIEGGTTGGKYTSGIYDDKNNISILNNIIQNNAVGVYLYYGGALVEYNLFKNNNEGTVGSHDFDIPGPGFGIVLDDDDESSITENAFKGNLGAAMWMSGYSDVAITDNTSEKDGSFVVIYRCNYVDFSRNQGQDFGAQGFLPVYGATNADAAIDLLGVADPSDYSNDYLQIHENVLREGRTLGYNGIAFSTIAGAHYNCEYCHVTNNTICRFAGNGIVAEPGSASYPTLWASQISGNDLENNGTDGILIGYATSTSPNGNNALFENKAEGNHGLDCADDTPGALTLSTDNTWYNNIGPYSYPTGLCMSRGYRH
jgi:hypothetical protein